MEAMGAAPGAKWGDLTTAVYTASGDVIHLSCHGVIAFSAMLHHPIRYIMKYWKDEPTVGINPGDGFIHNDARFGNVHNTDQSHDHAGHPRRSDHRLGRGDHPRRRERRQGARRHAVRLGDRLRRRDAMSPFKIVERGELRRDLLTFLQNSVRDPKLQLADMKVKLGAVRGSRNGSTR